MLILKRDTFEVESDSPRVPAEDAATVDTAVQIVDAARADAAQTVERANAEAAQTVERANAEAAQILERANAESVRIAEDAKTAYEDEKKRGYEDGLSKANAETLKRQMDLVAEADAYLHHVERELVGVVTEALRRCIGEIGADEIVLRLVRQGLDAVAKRQKYVKVSVAGKSLADAGDRLRALQQRYPSVLTFEVEAAEDLKDTGCRIQTDAGVIQGSFDDQIAAIEEAMKRRFEEKA